MPACSKRWLASQVRPWGYSPLVFVCTRKQRLSLVTKKVVNVQPHNLKVVGSNPPPATNYAILSRKFN